MQCFYQYDFTFRGRNTNSLFGLFGKSKKQSVILKYDQFQYESSHPLAIQPAARSCGYGKQALRIIDDLYPNKWQVADFEMADGSASNNAQQSCSILKRSNK